MAAFELLDIWNDGIAAQVAAFELNTSNAGIAEQVAAFELLNI